jgi:hypothetical protein
MIHWSAWAVCNLTVEIAKLIAGAFRRLAELSVLPSVEAPFLGL